MAAQSAPGLLLVMVDIPAALEADFNRLYDTLHLPEVVAVPGVLGGRQYQAVEAGTPKYQSLYELARADIVESAAFREMTQHQNEWSQRIRPQFQNLQRGVFTQIYPAAQDTLRAPTQVGGVLLVGPSFPPERDEEFNVWYNTEHLPFLSAVPGMLRARRFAAADDPKKYLTITLPKLIPLMSPLTTYLAAVTRLLERRGGRGRCREGRFREGLVTSKGDGTTARLRIHC